MKNLRQKLMVLSLGLLLCLLPLAAQASLLSDRLAMAFENGRAFEASVGLDLDDSIGMLFSMPEESFLAVQQLLDTTALKASVAFDDAGLPEIGLALYMQDTLIADGHAWLMDEMLAVTTSLLPGKTLLVDGSAFIQGFQEQMEQITAQTENLQGIGDQLEKYTAIISEWADSIEVTVNEEGSPGTRDRDAATWSATARVMPAQLKELMVALAEALSQDETLAAFTTDMTPADIQALVPSDGIMEWTVYMDENEEIAGINGIVPVLFENSGVEGRFSYNHLSGGREPIDLLDSGLERHRFGVEFTEEDVGRISLGLTAESDPGDPHAPKGRYELNLYQADTDATTEMALKHAYMRTLAEDHETLESLTDFNMQTRSNINDADDPTTAILSSMGDSAFSAAMEIVSDTRAQGEDDFLCESSLGISFMGLKLGSIRTSLSSVAYAQVDTSGNELIEIENLDDEGNAALEEALNVGLGLAMEQAMSMLPPELLQMLMAQ